METATIRVTRYLPEKGTEPFFQDYKVPYRNDMVVLDAINYMLCYSACPIYGLNEKFLGPAATALAYRYIEDSRDQGKDVRFPIVHEMEGVWECTLVGECSVVCPKGVDPMLAIQKTKILGATNALKSLLMPRGK